MSAPSVKSTLFARSLSEVLISPLIWQNYGARTDANMHMGHTHVQEHMAQQPTGHAPGHA